MPDGASLRQLVDPATRILVAAEQNIALCGLNGLSIKTVLKQSGHRNSSAIQYHFGDREGLVVAILAYRRIALEEHKAVLYDDITDGGKKQASIRQLLSVFVMSFVDTIRRDPENCYYLRFLNNIIPHRDFYRRLYYGYTPKDDVPKLTAALIKDIKAQLEWLPPRLMESRIGEMFGHMLSHLAFLEVTALTRSPVEWAWRVEALLDALTSVLESTPSPSTLDLLAREHALT